MPTAVAEPETDLEIKNDNEMPDNVENPENETQTIIEPTPGGSPLVAETPRLDQMMGEIRTLVGYEPEVPEVPETPETLEAPPATETPAPEGSTATGATGELDIEGLFKDPTHAPKLNSIIDQRAAALAKSNREKVDSEVQARVAAEAAEKARVEAEAEYEALVELANSEDDLSDEVLTARKKLAQKTHITKLKETWQRTELPSIREAIKREEVQKYADLLVGDLETAYEKAYTQIPELQDPSFLQSVNHRMFTGADEWLTALVNKVADTRLANKQAELEAAAEAHAKELAAAQTTTELAQYRTRFPEVDRQPPAASGERSGVPAWKTVAEVEAAFLNDDLPVNQRPSSGYVRWARENLPYQ